MEIATAAAGPRSADDFAAFDAGSPPGTPMSEERAAWIKRQVERLNSDPEYRQRKAVQRRQAAEESARLDVVEFEAELRVAELEASLRSRDPRAALARATELLDGRR